jgi:hypothetical protein
VSGVYTLLVTAEDDSTRTFTFEVATKLEKRIGDEELVFVVIYVQEGVVVSAADKSLAYPRLERSTSSKAQFLFQETNVRAALNALVGATVSELTDKMATLEAAWNDAVTSKAPTVSNQAAAVGKLLAAGWSL